eukprot:2750502-Rhodomonas_salina.1
MRGFFEVSDDGDLRWYLGVNYVLQGGDLIAMQTAYLDRVLERYGMTDCKPAQSPMPKNFAIDPDTLPEHGDPKHVEEMRSIL